MDSRERFKDMVEKEGALYQELWECILTGSVMEKKFQALADFRYRILCEKAKSIGFSDTRLLKKIKRK